jgi:hypothetical protein
MRYAIDTKALLKNAGSAFACCPELIRLAVKNPDKDIHPVETVEPSSMSNRGR